MTPFWVSIRRPTWPEEKVLSVAAAIQLEGSVELEGQTLAERVVPETWKRRE